MSLRILGLLTNSSSQSIGQFSYTCLAMSAAESLGENRNSFVFPLTKMSRKLIMSAGVQLDIFLICIRVWITPSVYPQNSLSDLPTTMGGKNERKKIQTQNTQVLLETEPFQRKTGRIVYFFLFDRWFPQWRKSQRVKFKGCGAAAVTGGDGWRLKLSLKTDGWTGPRSTTSMTGK